MTSPRPEKKNVFVLEMLEDFDSLEEYFQCPNPRPGAPLFAIGRSMEHIVGVVNMLLACENSNHDRFIPNHQDIMATLFLVSQQLENIQKVLNKSQHTAFCDTTGQWRSMLSNTAPQGCKREQEASYAK